MRKRAFTIPGVFAVLAGLLIASLPQASALADIRAVQPGSGLAITFVARSCSEYTDVMANKARNNIMESLRDLGADSNYPSNGIVDPTSEQTGSPDCVPLPNWRMTMGTGYVGKSSSTLELSTVTGAYATNVTTQASTPTLDPLGRPTGGTLEGAVTVTLDAQQATYVQRGGRIWVQGGTPSAPLNGQQTTYGFAALRCAQDAVNGDNVEFVTFPQDQTHVFCYYYAVTPPPDPGTITIRKALAAGQAGPADFTFVGNISYADSDGDGVNDFSLRATASTPGSVTFVRGAVGPGDPAWTVSEVVPDGWDDPGPPVCVADGSTITTTGGVTSIRLASGSNVVCTYTNQRQSLGNGLLFKETVGGVGSFPVTITGPNGFSRSDTATTTEPNVPELVASDTAIPAGVYTISEELPAATGAGGWELVSAVCSGVELVGTVVVDGQWRRIDVDVPSGGDAECLWVNEFTPAGSITITKTTTGDVGTFPYAIDALDASGNVVTEGRFSETATTTAEGVPVTAVPEGQAPTGIVVEPASRFLVQELLPAWSDAGHWQVSSIDCGANEVSQDRRSATAVIVLTSAAPAAVCAFVNEWVPAASLTVQKFTSSDTALRPDAAELRLSCTESEWPDESAEFDFAVPSGASASAVQEYTVMHATVCRVTEPATGAAGDVAVATRTTVAVDGGAAVALASYDASFAIARGTRVEVVVDNVLTREQGELAASGADPAPLAGVGILSLVAGLVALGWARRRRVSVR
ncbi:MAG: hypothetical protein DI534_04050 [Leifsonia xyli]|nr:MAG: hypothetical protein DI534_04050 [Leifsonia xyli]